MARACKEPVELRLREFSDEDVRGHAKLVALELARRAAEADRNAHAKHNGRIVTDERPCLAK